MMFWFANVFHTVSPFSRKAMFMLLTRVCVPKIAVVLVTLEDVTVKFYHQRVVVRRQFYAFHRMPAIVPDYFQFGAFGLQPFRNSFQGLGRPKRCERRSGLLQVPFL